MCQKIKFISRNLF